MLKSIILFIFTAIYELFIKIIFNLLTISYGKSKNIIKEDD